MMEHTTTRPTRTFAKATVATIVALTMLAGCSSGSEGETTDDGTDATSDVTIESDPAAQSTPIDDGVADTDASEIDTATDGSSSSSEDAQCGGLSATDVGNAVGAGDFDSADDISVDADITCLFSNSTDIYGVTVSTEPTATYLAGDLDGASTDDALSSLETLLSTVLGEPTTTRVTVDGNEAVLVSGTLLTGGSSATIGTVVDGMVVVVSADGEALAADPAGFEPIVTAVLALATSGA